MPIFSDLQVFRDGRACILRAFKRSEHVMMPECKGLSTKHPNLKVMGHGDDILTGDA